MNDASGHVVHGQLCASDAGVALGHYRVEVRGGGEGLAEALTDESGRFLVSWSQTGQAEDAVDVVVFRPSGGRLGRARLSVAQLDELTELEFTVGRAVDDTVTLAPAQQLSTQVLVQNETLDTLYRVVLDAVRAGLLEAGHGLFSETMWVHQATTDLERLHELVPTVLHGQAAGIDATRLLITKAPAWPPIRGRELPDLGPHRVADCLLKLIDPYRLVGAGVLLDALAPRHNGERWLDRLLGFYLDRSAPVRAVLHAAQQVRSGDRDLIGFAELYRAAMPGTHGDHGAGNDHGVGRGLPFEPSRWDPCTIAWGRCTGLIGEAGPDTLAAVDVPVIVGRVDPAVVCQGWQGTLDLYPRANETFPTPEPTHRPDEGLALSVRDHVIPLTVVPNEWTESRITVRIVQPSPPPFGCARVFWRSPVDDLADRLVGHSDDDCYNMLGITREIVRIDPPVLQDHRLALVGAAVLAFTAEGQSAVVADACKPVQLRWRVDAGICHARSGQGSVGTVRVRVTNGADVILDDAPLVGGMLVSAPTTTTYTLSAESFADGQACSSATARVTVHRIARITLSTADRVFHPNNAIPVTVSLSCPAPSGGLPIHFTAVDRLQPQLPVFNPMTVQISEGETVATAQLAPSLRLSALADVTATAAGHIPGTVTLRISPTACLSGSFGINPARYGGRWEIGPTIPGVVGVHLAVLPTGEVLLFSYDEGPNPGDFLATSLNIADSNRGRCAVWDPATGAVNNIPLGRNLFCSHHCLVGDGQLFVAGGQFPVPFLAAGAHRDLHLFNASSRSWARIQPDMPVGRWYPTCATLPDGKVLVISGNDRIFANPGGIQNSLQIFDPMAQASPTGSSRAALEPTSPLYHLYPFVHVVPSGQVFVHWKRTTSLYNPATKVWTRTGWPLFQAGLGSTVHPVSRTGPGPGTSVLLPLRPKRDPVTGKVTYPAGRIMILGGSTVEGEPDPATPPPVPGEVYRDAAGNELLNRGTPATETAEILDLDDAYPQQWRATASMAERRVMPDSVLLPDGKVLVLLGANFGRSGGFMIHFGRSWGATNAANQPEIFDPDTETWETMCRMGTMRLYHATAALLPDARVVVAGHDGFLNAPPFTKSEYRLEIFSPPYLFRGPRPRILQAPDSLAYQERFFVRTDDASTIASAALLRYSSVTHQTNTDQRYVGLEFQAAHLGLWLTAPPDGGVAPPGYYMMFLLSGEGVPSIAHPVRIR